MMQKKNKCKFNKCKRSLRKRMNKYKRVLQRKLRRCVRGIRRNIRHFQKRRRDLLNRLKRQIKMEKLKKKCQTLKGSKREKCFRYFFKRIAAIKKQHHLKKMHKMEKRILKLKRQERRHLARQRRSEKKKT